MILVQEITQWDSGNACNHTYITNESKDKMFGYFKRNDPKQFQMFKTPIRFDSRYRKFKIIKSNLHFAGETSANKVWQVNGSKNNVYTVEETENGMNCSCVGFKYHGACKHIDGVLNENK